MKLRAALRNPPPPHIAVATTRWGEEISCGVLPASLGHLIAVLDHGRGDISVIQTLENLSERVP